jgi:histidine ammonia-lyase
LAEDGQIYGVTTGFGDSCSNLVPKDKIKELPRNLVRFHNCGLGSYFNVEETRAIMTCRLISLCQGKSGVSYSLLTLLADMLNHNILPRIPSEGSVGASGDLTPMSYVAAAMIGEGEVYYQGKICSSISALATANLEPITLRPKEGLALMNGTAVMTGLAILAFRRAQYLSQLSGRITALNAFALESNEYHFDELLFKLKPHPGQMLVAKWIREDLNSLDSKQKERNPFLLQDRYSIRCAPHVIGVLQDALEIFRPILETELNSSNDNPLVDAIHERILHGGHFYGGHVAFVMDSLKTCIANVADLLDRQIALVVDPKFNNGLPSNLSLAPENERALHHGFKAVQIGASAWTAEALKLCMPASVFSRSTECHNQDKVSMGTIAARDCLRILELTEQVLSASLLCSVQAVKCRLKYSPTRNLSPKLESFVNEISKDFKDIVYDRPLEADLRKFCQMIRNEHWAIYKEIQ